MWRRSFSSSARFFQKSRNALTPLNVKWNSSLLKYAPAGHNPIDPVLAANTIRLFDSLMEKACFERARHLLARSNLEGSHLLACYYVLLDTAPLASAVQYIEDFYQEFSFHPPADLVAHVMTRIFKSSAKYPSFLSRFLTNTVRSYMTMPDHDLLVSQTHVASLSDFHKAQNKVDFLDSLAPATRQDFEALYERDCLTRQLGLETGLSEQHDECSQVAKSTSVNHGVASLFQLWEVALEIKLKRPGQIEILLPKKNLGLLSAKILSTIVAREFVQLCIHSQGKESQNSNYVSILAMKIAASAEKELNNTFIQTYLSRRKASYQQMLSQIKNKSKVGGWTFKDRAQLGAALIEMAMNLFTFKSATNVNCKAFTHGYLKQNGKRIGAIFVSESLLNKIATEKHLDFQPRSSGSIQMPMLVTPRAWSSHTQGGYVFSTDRLLSTNELQAPEQESYVKEAMDNGQMDDYLSGVNALSSTAWVVNKRVLEVLQNLYESGHSYLGIPGLQGDRDGVDATEYWRSVSERNAYGYALDTAHRFKNDRFYFTYKIDFRGRCYPQSSSEFKHMSRDSIRALFLFWKAKTLGDEGLYWLKVHLANVFGYDKAPIEERVAFVNDNWRLICESAMSPLTGQRWWSTGAKPFQVLAACFEIVDAVKVGPENYKSRLPVGQDGTCNGLQHYAALALDKDAAKKVNMVAGEVVSDVYLSVADKVKALCKDDKMSYNMVTRALVKEPVMTSVFGVTNLGIMRQVLDKLKDLTEERKLDVARNLTRKIQLAIKSNFSSAHSIQSWLELVCHRICQSVNYEEMQSLRISSGFDFPKLRSMIWTSPLGLPVVQPYRDNERTTVKTSLQYLSLMNPYAVGRVDARKQKHGVAPNFIHSLDSSHMLMTANRCKKEGLEFAEVHDSFWTHACDVPALSRYLRETFVELHEQDLLHKLYEELVARHSGSVEVMYLRARSKSFEAVEEFQRSLRCSDEKELFAKQLELEFRRFSGEDIQTMYTLAKGDLSRTKSKGSIAVLAPLEIPLPPDRGSFDLKEVLHSRYFFN